MYDLEVFVCTCTSLHVSMQVCVCPCVCMCAWGMMKFARVYLSIDFAFLFFFSDVSIMCVLK